MRLAKLSLERYGRFQDCELNFRAGSPDLHIVYGPNEAGKSTSLAAVSDLFFGFQTRSPYNFMFDYALLRVGAEIECSGQALACRRKKGASGTLLDATDSPIDEASLIAMLKGQTRETFQQSFSLNQEALRSGGKAIVEARDDFGRTLFAAGSGLTGVAEKLKALEAEADAIWGPSTRQSRTFTQAQKQYSEATRAVKEQSLKPKAWSDAKSLVDRTRAALEEAKGQRTAVQAELLATERVRRLLPLARQLETQLQALEEFQDAPDLGRQREDTAVRLIEEADAAVRLQSAATQLRADIAERRKKVEPDPIALAQADEIDRLVADGGADAKAASDLVTIGVEFESSKANVSRLRKEAAANADAVPARSVAGKLRELAKAHGELVAAEHQIAESCEDIEARLSKANAQLAKTPDDNTSKALADAVEVARTLGADADDRCKKLRYNAEVAKTDVASTQARLAPWSGDVSDLLKLPIVGACEIEDIRVALTNATSEIKQFEDQARRCSEQVEADALAIAQMQTGRAVSPEEITEVREQRDKDWEPLRRYILQGTQIDAPVLAVEQFETSVTSADERVDLRFTFADASSTLSLLEQTKVKHKLENAHAEASAEKARERYTGLMAKWACRLKEAGLPELDPGRFQTWQSNRERAQKAAQDLRNFEVEADNLESRRDMARAALCEALGIADPGGEVAPVLVTAERSRAGIERAAQAMRLVQAELEQIDTATTKLNLRQKRLEADKELNASQWTDALAQAGLQIDVSTCSAVLDLLDELREATASEAQLRRRIDGIARDASEHASKVAQVANNLGLEAADTLTCVGMLKMRLAAAREAETIEKALNEEDVRREREASEAEAKLKALENTLAPLLLETKSNDRSELLAAIERSRSMRSVREQIAKLEQEIVAAGDGLSLAALLAVISASDPESISDQVTTLNTKWTEISDLADSAATAHGDARGAFQALAVETTSAIDAASDAAQARSELETLAEHYILKRAQAVSLKWAIETYRERNQNPLLVRAGELFSTLTNGRYVALRVEADGSSPRLLGMRDDGRTVVDVDAMSEGTVDQLFLALRLAGVEQSVAAGINLPFLADDLFVNFDDQRAEAGFRVLAEVSKSTQVLFFTHHPHLVAIAKSVVGSELYSECELH